MTKQNCLLANTMDKDGDDWDVSLHTQQARSNYGDEAENVISVGYDLGGGTAFWRETANDQDEVRWR